MSDTLSEITYRVGQLLGVVREGTATGGSTTTVVDTVNRGGTYEPNDFWNGGTVWILHDAAGANAAPEGEYGTITDFVSGTYTITCTTLTAAVGSGDRYAIADRRYPLQDIIGAVNMALYEIGPIVTVDTTSVDTAAGQTEYDLPVAQMDLREVWIQMNTSDDDDNQWKKLRNWRVQRSTTGTADVLVFPMQPISSRDLMLVYVAPHTELYAYNNKLSEQIPTIRVVYGAALRLLESSQSDNPREERMYERLLRKSIEFETSYPIRNPGRTKSGIPLADNTAPWFGDFRDVPIG